MTLLTSSLLNALRAITNDVYADDDNGDDIGAAAANAIEGCALSLHTTRFCGLRSQFFESGGHSFPSLPLSKNWGLRTTPFRLAFPLHCLPSLAPLPYM